ncbi:MAG: beta strand repeat-containing protein [Sporichthyaceae bacterium]
MKRRTAITATAVTTLLALAAAGPAWAYWTVNSSAATGSAAAATLGAPTASAAQTLSAATITVTAKPASGPDPAGYRVDRISPTAATGVCTITGTTGSCTDPGFSALGNTYRVFATLGTNWVAATGTTTVSSVISTAYTVTAPANATAGTSFNLTVTATALGITDATYSGTKTITISGASNSPNGTVPTLTTTANFTLGVASIPVTLTNAVSTTLTVTNTGRTGTSGSINVGIAPQTYVLNGPNSVAAGATYTLSSMTAFDAYGNGFTGTKTVTWSGASNALNGTSPTYPTSTVAFSNGTATTALSGTFVRAGAMTLQAATSGVTTGTKSITVIPNSTVSLKWQSVSNPTGGAIGVATCNGASTCSISNLGNGSGQVTASVLVTDSLGNPVNGTVVSLSTVSTAGGSGTLTASTVTTGVNGVAGPFTFTAPAGNGFEGSVTATYNGGTATMSLKAK